ncbi:MAG TPA: protealysin inhibitor emfourin [Polyangiaceae bacterium]|jgi:hypothetical protein
MRITLQTDGGFAFLPGLAAPVTIDTDHVSPDERGRWEDLIGTANVWDLPDPTMPGIRQRTAEGARDHRMYTLTVEQGPHRRTLRFSEPFLAELAPLVHELLARGRKRPAP